MSHDHLSSIGLSLLQDVNSLMETLKASSDSKASTELASALKQFRIFVKVFETDLPKSLRKSKDHLASLSKALSPAVEYEGIKHTLQQVQKKEVQRGIDLLLANSNQVPFESKKVKKHWQKRSHKLESTLKKAKSKKPLNQMTSSVLSELHNALKRELSGLSKDKSKLRDTQVAAERLQYTLQTLKSKKLESQVKALESLNHSIDTLVYAQLLLAKIDRLLVKRVVTWSQMFLAASKSLEIDETRIPEYADALALVALRKQLMGIVEKQQKELASTWLGKSSMGFHKALRTQLQALKKSKS